MGTNWTNFDNLQLICFLDVHRLNQSQNPNQIYIRDDVLLILIWNKNVPTHYLLLELKSHSFSTAKLLSSFLHHFPENEKKNNCYLWYKYKFCMCSPQNNRNTLWWKEFEVLSKIFCKEGSVFFVILNKNSGHLCIKLNANETIIQFVRFYQADGERVIWSKL